MKFFGFQWHITDECDQRCKHCYIFSQKNIHFHRSHFDEMQAIVANCENMCQAISREPHFSITGGDPILHKDFWKLLSLLKSKNISFSILGNPFHLTESTCKRLRDLGCQRYQLSLDGLEKTHDFIRKRGSYQDTIKKIRILNETGITTAIMSTVSKLNINDIPSIIDVVVENSAKIFAFARYCPVSYQSNTDIEEVSPTEYKDLLDKCWKKFSLYRNSGTSFSLKDHLWILYLYEKGLFKIDKSLDDNTIYEGCNCGINHMTILPDATVFACRRMNSPIGNALKETMYDIFHGEKLNAYRQFDKFQKCSKCELLRFCRGCPATSFSINGNMYAPDPQCWK